MPHLVTCKFDKDPIKNECASVETSFSHYTIYDKIFQCQNWPTGLKKYSCLKV